MQIREEINGIKVWADLPNGINCIDLGESGTGKTFLFSLLYAYCTKNEIGCRLYTYNSISSEIALALRNLPDNVEMLLFDNADLYFNEEIAGLLLNRKNRCVVISLKDGTKLKGTRNWYRIVYRGDGMEVKAVKG